MERHHELLARLNLGSSGKIAELVANLSTPSITSMGAVISTLDGSKVYAFTSTLSIGMFTIARAGKQVDILLVGGGGAGGGRESGGGGAGFLRRRSLEIVVGEGDRVGRRAAAAVQQLLAAAAAAAACRLCGARLAAARPAARRGRGRVGHLRAEYASLGAGRRHYAASSEHRVNTREAETVNAAEYDRTQWNTLRSRGLVGRQELVFCF